VLAVEDWAEIGRLHRAERMPIKVIASTGTTSASGRVLASVRIRLSSALTQPKGSSG
jgi:hypothetical protein